MDIRKLQRAIVDGLEDVKAQHIVVFNTEHLSPLFERVVIASGTSNRQTKALAASVKDAVKAKGFSVMRIEGADNGEWIIVDCGAAVCHIMQPAIRQYYHLEEIWGDKPVKLKLDSQPRALPKASDDGQVQPAPRKRARPAKVRAAGDGGASASAKKSVKKTVPKATKKTTLLDGELLGASAKTTARKTAATKTATGGSAQARAKTLVKVAAQAAAKNGAGAAPRTAAKKGGGAKAVKSAKTTRSSSGAKTAPRTRAATPAAKKRSTNP